MDTIQLDFEWPSLPAKRYQAARRVAEMCTIHATLQHPPTISIGPIHESMSTDAPRQPVPQGAA